MKKIGRNDPCSCGSGKKFKKCCESKMIGGRFMATKVDTASAAQIKKTMNMTSLFHARLAETPKKRMPPVSVDEQNLEEKEKIC
jgi:hypothetical protein